MFSARAIIVYLALIILSVPNTLYAQDSPKDLQRIVLSHDLNIKLSPDEHKIEATDRVEIFVGPRFTDVIHVLLNKKLEISSITMGDSELEFENVPNIYVDLYGQKEIPLVYKASYMEFVNCVRIKLPFKTNALVSLVFEYSGVIYDPPEKTESFRHIRGDDTNGVISSDGVYLSGSSYWYPCVDGSFPKFNVTATTPNGWDFIGQGTFAGKEVIAGHIGETVAPEPQQPIVDDPNAIFTPIENKPEDITSPVNNDRWVTKWTCNSPTDDCSIVAGKYMVTEEVFNGIRIATYLFPEDQEQSATFIDMSKKYLDFYSKLISPYPYGSFSVVENFFTSGFGMPSYTLLGTHNIKNPQRYTGPGGLGHEILHCWWGNSVFVDYSEGNWCEGLTTYMSNYLYKELEGTLADQVNHRHDVCAEYAMSVTRDTDYAVSTFMGKTTEQDNVLGYGKISMIFHMLRRLVGDKSFNEGIKDFAINNNGTRASWSDIRVSFEKVSDQKLDWFFDQWVNRKGAPRVFLQDIRIAEYVNSGSFASADSNIFTIDIRLSQQSEDSFFYKLMVPIYIKTETDEVLDYVFLTTPATLLKYKMISKPKVIAIDPQFDLFRKLEKDELNPCYDLTLSDVKKIAVYATGGTEEENASYMKLAEFLSSQREFEMVADKDVTEEQLTSNSIFLFGSPAINSVTAKVVGLGATHQGFAFVENGIMYGKDTYGYDKTMLLTFRSPFNKSKNLTMFTSPDAETALTYGKFMSYYRTESYYIWTRPGSPNIRGRFEVKSSAYEYTND